MDLVDHQAAQSVVIITDREEFYLFCLYILIPLTTVTLYENRYKCPYLTNHRQHTMAK